MGGGGGLWNLKILLAGLIYSEFSFSPPQRERHLDFRIFQKFEVKLKCNLFIALEKILVPAPTQFERGSRRNENLQSAVSTSELAGPGCLYVYWCLFVCFNFIYFSALSVCVMHLFIFVCGALLQFFT